MTRFGVWLVGARGSVATTVITGAAAVRAGLAAPVGCVTELPEFRAAGLPTLDTMVVGGHDVSTIPLVKRAEQLVNAGVLPPRLLEHVRAELAAVDSEIRPGTEGLPDTGSQADIAAGLARDMVAFRTRHQLERVVVVNLASTEARATSQLSSDSLVDFEDRLADRAAAVPASVLYAYAAMLAGCSYANFTPSTAMELPALDELARSRALPYAGNDGKTGETLVKTALAPMFAHRALLVRSWSGTNILGGGDGATLAEPDVAASKLSSKARSLEHILGHVPEGETHIDHVPEMGEWKTAWNHISFEGFLGVRMTMQFTWQGCDSALAAPLVLDLARLLARAHEAGRRGAQAELGFFFKDPVGAADHRMVSQYETLREWAASLSLPT
jgi:myo-inositol-1-phosphate synthase